MRATLRFLREHLKPSARQIAREEKTVDRDGLVLPAILYRPARFRGRLPAWVLLHGLTCTGREHPSLDRFARALAASGAAVLVPEIPEWRGLYMDAGVTEPTLWAGMQGLCSEPIVDPDRIGAFGFSFGATQALTASTHQRLTGTLAAVVSWGGYSDILNLCRFGVTGEHELDGQEFRVDPDRYGSWILGGQYLTGISGLEDATELASALRRLATEAGSKQIDAGSPVHDPTKEKLRSEIPARHREVFDVFAPPSGQPPANLDRARSLAEDLAGAALEAQPELDPAPLLDRVLTPNILGHGRGDRLIPFTETLRLRRQLPDSSCRGHTITRLFSHSRGEERPGAVTLAAEGVRFLHMLNRILRLC